MPNTNKLIPHLLAILALPFIVIVVVPLLLLYIFPASMWEHAALPVVIMAWIISLVALGAGLYLLVSTLLLFQRVGKGTLAPWSPPEHMVAQGIYQYMRNPMITGVVFILAGETLFFGSFALLAWTLGFFLGNHLYFLLSEEPKLVQRFGHKYEKYQANVPRWLPRRTPWGNGGGK